MRWLLHIGAPKTGSTAVQRMLFDNRHALLQRGVLYPEASLRGFGHHDLAFLVGGGYPAWATSQPRSLDDIAGELARSVSRSPAGTVVLSSENFFLYPNPAALRARLVDAGLAATDAVEVHCYVRRQDEALSSWYNQTVKAQGNTLGFADTVAKSLDLFDYATRLAPWRDVFGAPSVRVRDYADFERDGADVRLDMLARLGVSSDGLTLPPGRTNDRINRDVLSIQRLVNRLPIPVASKRRYHHDLIALTAESASAGVFDDRPFWTPDAARAIVDNYADSNRAVARDYLGMKTLFSPPDGTGGAIETAGAPAGVTLAKIAYVVRWAAARSRSSGLTNHARQQP